MTRVPPTPNPPDRVRPTELDAPPQDARVKSPPHLSLESQSVARQSMRPLPNALTEPGPEAADVRVLLFVVLVSERPSRRGVLFLGYRRPASMAGACRSVGAKFG